MSRRGYVWIAAALLVLGALALARHHTPVHAPRDPITGGDGAGLARATPQYERIDAAALERALQDPAARGLQVLVVMRDAHLVFDRYGDGTAADTPVDGGPFARTVLALAAGIAASEGMVPPALLKSFDANALRGAIEGGSGQRYTQYLSQRLWSRLNAHAAWIELPSETASAPADCCLHAQTLDWVRVAAVLADQGRFEGKQVVPEAWVQQMQRGFGLELPSAASGAEPFAVSGVFFVRGPQHWRMWLVPSLRLAILFGASGGTALDETRLPNLVIRAIGDRPPEPGNVSDLQRLVPGH